MTLHLHDFHPNDLLKYQNLSMAIQHSWNVKHDMHFDQQPRLHPHPMFDQEGKTEMKKGEKKKENEVIQYEELLGNHENRNKSG